MGDAAILMGDSNRANTFLQSIDTKFVKAGFPYPWYDAEAGWFMRLNAYLMGARPL